MFESFFFLIFGGIVLVIIVSIFRGIWNTVAEKQYNDSQPVSTEKAKISAKRSELSGGGNTSVSTDYYATFEFKKNQSLSNWKLILMISGCWRKATLEI